MSSDIKTNLKHNLIIAGIGGQGINSLARVLAEFLYQSGYQCQFTVHKGGAQSLGSVYAEIRISSQADSILGQGVPQGELDLLFALEPWEALRHVSLAHAKTQLWVETQTQPLFVERLVERSNERVIESPEKQLNVLPLKIHWRDYQKIALQQSGTIKMANYYLGLDCVSALDSMINKIDPAVFDKLFFKFIKKAKR